jgi:type II secretory pathway component PulM
MNFNLETLKQFRIDLIKDYILRLSDRERLIVLGSAAAVSLLLVIIILSTAIGSLSSLRKKIDANREILARIEILKKEYEDSKRQIEKLEETINRTPASFSLASHLESLAQTYGIQPDSMNPKTAPANDLYIENQVEVRIPKVTLPALTDYLYKIENSQGFVRVNALNIKPNYADTSYLSAVFTVSVFMAKP